jgi:hypothetical protein
MEASRSMIFSRTLSQPVMRPATRPPAWRQRGQPGLVPVEIRWRTRRRPAESCRPPSGRESAAAETR